MLATELNKKLRNIASVRGYLVPGQERVLYKLSASLNPGSTIVEIGSYLGKSTACLAYGTPKKSIIYAIDTFKGGGDFIRGIQFKGKNFYPRFKKNLKKLGLFHKIKPLSGRSSEVGMHWNKKIDLLFIDGSHLYKDVKKDFELFFPWVKPGGIVAFHDVHEKFPGVYRVWNEIAKNKLHPHQNSATLYYGFKKHSKFKPKKKVYLNEIVQGKNPKVFVIIPVHNRLKYTKRCLLSFSNQSYKNFEVIIVDAGSTDGTSSYIKRFYHKHKIINGSKNWWWTKSMYEGVKEALTRAEENDLVLSINNDCFVKRNYLTNITRASIENRRAIVGSLILDAEKPTRVIDAGVKIHWPTNLIYAVSKKISKKLKFYSDRNIIENIDTLPGKGSVIPIEVFLKIGNFNYKLLPHYLGDYEFFSRAKQKGFNLLVSSAARVYNYVKKTGYYKKGRKAESARQVFFLLFGRKSKNNILDYTFFLILRCPKKYLLSNLYDLFLRVLSYFPLTYKVKLLYHNFPIYLRQNTVIMKARLLVHNIPIYIKQNRQSKNIIKFFEKYLSAKSNR